MSKIVIGESEGKQLKLDIDLLITSRLLIQANSGGGKSWLLRRLAEQCWGKVQTIIIDPEGEFFTLREKFGYVLVGEGGETPADVRSAALLAEKFLQLKASAVCDLYEAFRGRPMEQRQWVRAFLEGLLGVPRTLWHPVLVIVDEAHKFCPQETPKAGNQKDREIISECKNAMISLSTTGRKRGFCAIWATQRLAKVDKDASAEMFNRMVGMTIEDVDVDRAADLMSVSKEEKRDFRASLRTLNPGDFYAFGRAISTERTLVKVGDVQTHHPETPVDAPKLETPPVRSITRPAASVPVNGSSDLPGVEQNILNQVAELEALGIANPEKSQVALMAGYTNYRSGGFSEPLARLLQRGLLLYPSQGLVALTDAGRAAAAPQERPLTRDELHDRLCQKLGGAEAKILREIISAYPEPLQKDELGQKLGYTNPRSGGFSEPVGRLRALGIIDYPRQGVVKAADWLFIEGAA